MGELIQLAARRSPGRLDLCECGHTYGAHMDGCCLAYVPSFPLKKVRELLDAPHPWQTGHTAIDRVTATAVASTARAAAHDNKSSVCACLEYRPSGYRAVVPDDAELAELIKLGKRFRVVERV